MFEKPKLLSRILAALSTCKKGFGSDITKSFTLEDSRLQATSFDALGETSRSGPGTESVPPGYKVTLASANIGAGFPFL